MKKLFIMLMAVFLMAGAAYAKGLEVKKRAGDYNVAVTFDKNPVVVGDNNMEILVSDVSGNVVTDARVKVEYSMPAMPGMPAMNYKTDAAMSGGKYAAKMNLSMSGAWNIAVKIMKGGKITTVKFNIDA